MESLLVVRGFTEVPFSHLRCQLSTRHALRVPFQGSLIKASLKGRGTNVAGGGSSVESFACCVRLHGKYPSVTCGDSSAQGTPFGALKGSLVKPPLKGRGTAAGGGFFCGIFCLVFQASRKYPSVPAVTAQHKARPSGALKGSLSKASLKGRGTSVAGGGVLLWNLLLGVSGFTEIPLSHLRCQLPLSGEP